MQLHTPGISTGHYIDKVIFVIAFSMFFRVGVLYMTKWFYPDHLFWLNLLQQQQGLTFRR